MIAGLFIAKYTTPNPETVNHFMSFVAFLIILLKYGI